MISGISSAWAGTYPWIPLHEGEIQVIPNPKVEAAIRLALIHGARSTIDVVTYDQRLDPAIGMPILVALREAANRGVQVRFLNSWFTELVSDFHKLVPRYLTEPPTHKPIQVKIIGGPQAHRQGWGYADGIHDKLLVVDGRAVLTTGRGQSDYYLHWLDTAFVIQGGLVEQSVQAFENLWRDTGKDNPNYDRHGRYITTPIPVPLLREPALDEAEAKEFARLTQWLVAEPSTVVTGRARLLHYNFIHQLRSLPGRERGYNYASRIRLLDDVVTDALSELIAEATTEVRFTTLSVIPHPKLKAAIYGALDRHVPIRILTNGRSAYKSLKILPAPWWVSLPDLEEVMRHGAQVRAFAPSPTNPWAFMHLKTAIVGDTVIFGSHNMNLPSTVAKDEICFEVENHELAQTLGGLFEHAYENYGLPQNLGQIQHARRVTGFARWLFKPLMGIF